MNENPLTKSQLAWLCIRLIGLFCIFRGAVTLVMAIFGTSILKKPFVNGSSGSFTPFLFILLFGFSTVGLIALGIYLVKNGQRVHGWLMFEGSIQEASVDPETELTEKQTIEFKKWIADNPAIESRDLIDQLALFRDYLNAQ